jgi:DNA-binding NarL/FixJ family response regulator
VHICLATAFDDEGLRAEAFAAGARGFFAKRSLFELETMLVSKLKGQTL